MHSPVQRKLLRPVRYHNWFFTFYMDKIAIFIMIVE